MITRECSAASSDYPSNERIVIGLPSIYEGGTTGMDVSGPVKTISVRTLLLNVSMGRQGHTRISLDGGERRLLARRLDVLEALACGEMRDLRGRGLRYGDDLGAIGELARVLAKHCHLCHDLLELPDHQILVRCDVT